jgi:hypothetical protein
VRFSQRIGLKSAQKALQLDEVDAELRNGLWSLYHEFVLKQFSPASHDWPARGDELPRSNLENLFFQYWYELYEQPTDTIPTTIDSAVEVVRKRFFSGSYGDVYDFLEVTLENFIPAIDLQAFWNSMLEKHNAAFRLIDGVATKITSDTEIASIETALDVKLQGVRTHLRSALEKLSDRKNPDYRNSVKESISAVESLAQSVTGTTKTTLGEALKVLGPAVGMHAAFRDALSKLYGYTSDADGIRHAILDEPNVTYTDALFMLVACSAFVNYVLGKAAEGKVRLPTTK